MDKVQVEVDGLCLKLRKVASESGHLWQSMFQGLTDCFLTVPVVDAFALSDHIVNSPLGRYDGDVYENYFNLVSCRLVM